MAAQALANAAIEEQTRFLNEAQEQLGNLAIAIAEKVIGQQLTLNPDLVGEIVGNAIKGANIAGACRIRINPKDYDLLGPSWNSIPSLQPSERKWELAADIEISRGGCVIEADGGTVDAQIETQLAQIRTAFSGVE
jgi:flagellar assembly protein FliH